MCQEAGSSYKESAASHCFSWVSRADIFQCQTCNRRWDNSVLFSFFSYLIPVSWLTQSSSLTDCHLSLWQLVTIQHELHTSAKLYTFIKQPSLPAKFIYLFFFRDNTECTCSDQLCTVNSHQVYQQPPGTPGFHGDGLAGHRGAQWSLVHPGCTRECSV